MEREVLLAAALVGLIPFLVRGYFLIQVLRERNIQQINYDIAGHVRTKEFSKYRKIYQRVHDWALVYPDFRRCIRYEENNYILSGCLGVLLGLLTIDIYNYVDKGVLLSWTMCAIWVVISVPCIVAGDYFIRSYRWNRVSLYARKQGIRVDLLEKDRGICYQAGGGIHFFVGQNYLVYMDSVREVYYFEYYKDLTAYCIKMPSSISISDVFVSSFQLQTLVMLRTKFASVDLYFGERKLTFLMLPKNAQVLGTDLRNQGILEA